MIYMISKVLCSYKHVLSTFFVTLKLLTISRRLPILDIWQGSEYYSPDNHYVKSVRIRSYSGPYSAHMPKNTDQNNTEYGHISRRKWDFVLNKSHCKLFLLMIFL